MNPTQPQMKPVEVQIPIVRLRIEDLSYLRGLATEGIKCIVPHGNKDRLRVLGLIEDKVLPPCPKEMRGWNKGVRSAKGIVSKEISKSDPDWQAIERASYAARRDKPKERRIIAVTKAGMKLIQNGTAKVQIMKGCR